jgi:hypothetical protein
MLVRAKPIEEPEEAMRKRLTHEDTIEKELV